MHTSQTGESNMFDLVYSKNKTLKDDNRMAYYSYYQVMCFPEMIYLEIFSILYTAATGISTYLESPDT